MTFGMRIVLTVESAMTKVWIHQGLLDVATNVGAFPVQTGQDQLLSRPPPLARRPGPRPRARPLRTDGQTEATAKAPQHSTSCSCCERGRGASSLLATSSPAMPPTALGRLEHMHWRASLLFTIFGIGQGGVGAIPVERVFNREIGARNLTI